FRRQLLVALEGVVQLGALVGAEAFELAHVLARLVALLRRHLLPLLDALADLLAFVRRQGAPLVHAVEHARLAFRRNAVPLVAQRAEHLALGGRQAVPRTRAGRRSRRRAGWRRRRTLLRPHGRGEAAEQQCSKQQQRSETAWMHGSAARLAG